MTGLPVWVVTPGLDRRGGTERCTAEELSRWQSRFAIKVFTHAIGDENLPETVTNRLRGLPAPHLVRFLWWFGCNHVVRFRTRRAQGAPSVTHSPGVNCLDADAIGVHMVFGRHRELTSSSGTGSLSS